MASTEKAEPESAKDAQPPPPAAAPRAINYFVIDVALRFLLFAAAVSSVVVIVTSKQTVMRGPPPGIPVEAKFNHSPAFIYFVAALSVAGLYSIVTALASVSVISNPDHSTKFLLYFAFLDALILGVVASATGTAGGVAYIGLKGNSHVRWLEVCSTFDKFCRHIGGALATALFASVVLVLLVWLSVFSLHSRIRK